MIVCAVALGTLEAHPRALGDLLAAIDAGLPTRLQVAVVRWFGNWTWVALATPLLRRPAWLPPASLALLAIGLALSVSGRKTPNHSRRRS
jgi:hypothetical protein